MLQVCRRLRKRGKPSGATRKSTNTKSSRVRNVCYLQTVEMQMRTSGNGNAMLWLGLPYPKTRIQFPSRYCLVTNNPDCRNGDASQIETLKDLLKDAEVQPEIVGGKSGIDEVKFCPTSMLQILWWKQGFMKQTRNFILLTNSSYELSISRSSLMYRTKFCQQ